MASAMSYVERVLFPSSRRLLAMIARPALSSASCRAPASTVALIATAGIVGFSTSSTLRPLSSVWLWTSNERQIWASGIFVVAFFQIISVARAVGNQIADCPAGRGQILGARSRHIVGRDGFDLVNVGVDIGKTIKSLNLPEKHRLVNSSFPRKDEMRLNKVFRPIQFLCGWAFRYD